jgi:hypothetical protein
MKARDASARKLADGKYEVTFTVEDRKLYADGKGKETEAALDEPFDLGVFTEEPGKKGYQRESVLLSAFGLWGEHSFPSMWRLPQPAFARSPRHLTYPLRPPLPRQRRSRRPHHLRLPY